jgi:hypothetical protein
MNTPIATEIAQANRLSAIAERIGFSVWQLQELESVAAQYLALRTELKPGMSASDADAAIAKALRNPFGQTLNKIAAAGLFEPALQSRLKVLLDERNWLVHRSRADNRSAVHSGAAAQALIARINTIAGESLILLREVGQLFETYVIDHGVSQGFIDKEAAVTLSQWHSSDGA